MFLGFEGRTLEFEIRNVVVMGGVADGCKGGPSLFRHAKKPPSGIKPDGGPSLVLY